jgi:hypothetical protein
MTDRVVSQERLTALVQQIVDDLFTNGSGQRADRLVLTIDGPPTRNLGGWCREAIRDRILEEIDPSSPPASGSPQAKVWLLQQWDEQRIGLGVRGVFVSREAADMEMRAIIREHPDLRRQDFVFETQRLRGGSSQTEQKS